MSFLQQLMGTPQQPAQQAPQQPQAQMLPQNFNFNPQQVGGVNAGTAQMQVPQYSAQAPRQVTPSPQQTPAPVFTNPAIMAAATNASQGPPAPQGPQASQYQSLIQNAIQQAIGQTGARSTYGTFDQNILGNLQGSGFTPQQLAAIQQGASNASSGNLGGVYQDAEGGNSAAELQSWGGNILNALNGMSNAPQTAQQPGQPQVRQAQQQQRY